MNDGFSHIGLGTHDMNGTIAFYDGLLGFKRIYEHTATVKDGGTMRLVYFEVGVEQFLVFMESNDVDGIPADYDTGINGALGVPSGMYHFAFKVPSIEALEERRQSLIRLGIEVTEVVDHGYARAIFFRDPNGLQLELYVQTRSFDPSDLNRTAEISVATTTTES